MHEGIWKRGRQRASGRRSYTAVWVWKMKPGMVGIFQQIPLWFIVLYDFAHRALVCPHWNRGLLKILEEVVEKPHSVSQQPHIKLFQTLRGCKKLKKGLLHKQLTLIDYRDYDNSLQLDENSLCQKQLLKGLWKKLAGKTFGKLTSPRFPLFRLWTSNS